MYNYVYSMYSFVLCMAKVFVMQVTNQVLTDEQFVPKAPGKETLWDGTIWNLRIQNNTWGDPLPMTVSVSCTSFMEILNAQIN